MSTERKISALQQFHEKKKDIRDRWLAEIEAKSRSNPTDVPWISYRAKPDDPGVVYADAMKALS